MRPGGWQLLMLAMALLLPGWACFRPLLLSQHMLAYRDAAHFYLPLEKWLGDGWRQGDWPLWNPQDGLGCPVAGEASAALFYPGRLLFFGPGAVDRQHAGYALLHLLIAALGAYHLARSARRTYDRPEAGWDLPGAPQAGASSATIRTSSRPVSMPAAGLCAVAYAFSGTVLFQYCNTIYLVGAAWLPWALLSTQRTLARRSPGWAIAWGTCLALMVLGGDPQTAYHAGLLGLLYMAVARGRGSDRSGDAPDARPVSASAAVGLAGVAALTMLLLAAVQFVPAWAWMRESDRASFTWPRNIYEIPLDWQRRHTASSPDVRDGQPPAEAHAGWRAVATGLFGVPPADEHHGRADVFSVAPWRLVEALWPNFSGRLFPINRRWLTAAAAEDRIWVPSLYLGIVPILLAAGVWRLRARDICVRWFSWGALLAVTASFGRYGAGWVVESVRALMGAAGDQRLLGDGVGGVYWWLAVSLPGYVQFRFPAKWLVPATLCIAVLAAEGCDQVLYGSRQRLMRHLRCWGWVSALAALLLALAKTAWTRACAGCAPDELYGPLDATGAWRDAVTAGVHAAVACGAAHWLLARRAWGPARLGTALLLLTAAELALAQSWMVQTVSRSVLDTPAVGDRLPTAEPTATLYRWPKRSWVPPSWLATSSPARPEETARWDVATLFGRLHLLGAHRCVQPLRSAPPRDLTALLATGAAELPHPSVLNLLGVDYLIVPADVAPPDPAWESIAVPPSLPNVALWRNTQAFPPAWIVHDVEVWPPWESSDPRALRRRCQQLVFPAGRPRDFRRQAVVETSAGGNLSTSTAPGTPREEWVRGLARGRNRLTLEAALAAPGLVVVAQSYDPHWRATAIADGGPPQTLPIVRANRVMQGVFLPAGRHTLTLRYRPWHIYWSGAVSAASWLVVLGIGAVHLVRARRASVPRRRGTGASSKR